MKGFRLISIELEDSDIYDGGLYQFSRDTGFEKTSSPYISLIIGPNGTGKSRLLKIVLDIFNDLYNLKDKKDTNFKFSFNYVLKYYLNGNIYKITNNDQLIINKDGENYYNILELNLPEKAIAAAYSLYEKFSPKSPISYFGKENKRRTRYDNDFYEYLGLKSDRNYTFSGAYITKSIDLITEALANDGFNKEVSHVFKILDFQPGITIKYNVKRNRELFSGNLTVDRFREIISTSNYDVSGFSYSTFKNLNNSSPDYLEQIVEAFNASSHELGPRLNRPLDLVFDPNHSYGDFKRIYGHLSLLRSLNFIHHKEIIVYKKARQNPSGIPIDIKSMSSGEIQILTSMLALSSIVKDNSLILIDEPEISLHPNWQLQYVEILNKVFKKSTTCHFLIASHSHFLVSDLKESSSSILSLIKNKNMEIVSELLDYDTEGWSTENILYNIFDISTVRNHYFEMDLREFLKLISERSGNKNKIRKYIEKFEKFNILPTDPLSVILEKAKTYLDENK